MNSMNKDYSTCSTCLEKVIKLRSPCEDQASWDQIGQSLPQCEACIVALKEKYTSAAQENKANVKVKLTS